MLIPWGNILSMAALTAIVTLVLLQLYRLWKKEVSLAYSLGLTLVCGVGFLGWFAIFNGFSLSSLNQDLPIPLFPISPEDIGCAITVGLLVGLFEWAVSIYRKNKNIPNLGLQAMLFAAALPIMVALIVDVYFI